MKITSTRVLSLGAHDHVSLWIDGKLSGEFVVGIGEGPELVALFVTEAKRAVLDAMAGVQLVKRGHLDLYRFASDIDEALVCIAELARRGEKA